VVQLFEALRYKPEGRELIPDGVAGKPSNPCCRFAACKTSLNGVEKAFFLAKLPDTILSHSSTFRY
jgi:hypothetical protein